MRGFLSWLGLLPLMIGNGVLREAVFAPRMDELLAHQVSTATAVIILALYTYLVFPLLRIRSERHAWRIGFLWVGLTVAFEFGFGRFVMGHPWSRLLADYNLWAGRVWLLFLIGVVIAPWSALAVRSPVAGDQPG